MAKNIVCVMFLLPALFPLVPFSAALPLPFRHSFGVSRAKPKEKNKIIQEEIHSFIEIEI